MVHGASMAAEALAEPRHLGHLVGDVPVLFPVALVLAFLTPRRRHAESMRRAA
nr:DUF6632 domain-containing protein [Paraburkholderia sp. BL8N3]